MKKNEYKTFFSIKINDIFILIFYFFLWQKSHKIEDDFQNNSLCIFSCGKKKKYKNEGDFLDNLIIISCLDM